MQTDGPKDNNKIKLSAEYVRNSSPNQPGTGIEDQMRINRKVTEPLGIKIIEDYIFIDRDTQGTLESREQLDKLLDIARSPNPPFSYIVVYDTSRLSRALLQTPSLCIDLADRGVYIYFSNQHMDSANREDLLKIAVNSITDFQSNENLSAASKRGVESQVLRGYSGGGKRYGYESRPAIKKGKNGRPAGHNLVIVPDQAWTIILIYRLYARGWSEQKIIDFLNKQFNKKGRHRPPNKCWRIDLITRILKSSIYIGIYIWNVRKTSKNLLTGKEKVTLNPPAEHIVEPNNELRIVSDELWCKVQEKKESLKKRSEGRSIPPKRLYSIHLLTGLSFCSVCGGTYSITAGGKYAKYGCCVAHNTRSVCSNTIKINKTVLEEAVLTSLFDQYDDKNKIQEISAEMNANLGLLMNSNKRKYFSKQMALAEQHISNILDMIKKGQAKQLNSDILFKELQKLEEEKLALQNELMQVDVLPDLIFSADLEKYYTETLSKLKDSNKAKHVLPDMIERIFIGPEDQGVISIEMMENLDNISSYILALGSQRDSRIVYDSRTGFVPYTARHYKITLPIK